MRVVGLISGGKDSIWNLHYCRQFEHEVVCLANLAPPPGTCELDSYMYQTVGSDLVEAIASALGLPLVRRTITGEPKATASNTYSPQEGDEVEDLTLLLQEVLQAHPGVQAVSCGAILSDYQRLRVENVCARLGLTVLAFLWRQEQERLLRQMISAGVDARLVKVACMGLSAKHVGASILSEELSEHLFRLGKRWGVHVCGEGGEYETAVLDAPLYHHAVHLLTSETAAHPDGGGDDVAFLQATEVAAGECKPAAAEPPFPALEAYSSLRYYEDTFPQLCGAGGTGCEPAASLPPLSETSAVSGVSEPLALREGGPPAPRRPLLRRVGELWASSSLDAECFGLGGEAGPAEQCEALLGKVEAWLQGEFGLSLHDAALAEVQVRDLGCFAAVNAVYARFFGPEPPPRLCIQTPLPESLHLRLRLLLRPRADTVSLRVQSISAWAMACIGPYSQARRAGPLLFSAGVLGLVPHSMALPCGPWQTELWLLMRSLHNVLQVMGSSFGEVLLAHVYTAKEVEPQEAAALALAYMRREAPDAAPLLACAHVPRLPKEGSVEVSVVCAAGPASAESVASRQASGVCVAVAEAPGDASQPEAVSNAVERCVADTLARVGGKSCSLQVQVALPDADDLVEASASAAARSLGLEEKCAVSCMPVLSLGPGTLVRAIALAS